MQISVIEEYLPTQYLEHYLDYCRETDDWSKVKTNNRWSERVVYLGYKGLFSTTNQYFLEKTDKQIKQSFELVSEIYPDYLGLVRWNVGDSQAPHADGENPNGDAHPFNWRNFGCVYYMNDDYEGGEIYFPNQDITLKPKPNTLVFFPGTLEYLHGVNPVTSGVRYTLTSFWTFNERYKLKL